MAQYDLNLREYWRIIKKRRWIILITLVLTGTLSTLFALLNKPVPLYKSTASVRLERVMLAGGGIYRLGEAWYPVQAGDFIWMAPYCPQWFGALGKSPAKYLIYKDWDR